MRIYILSKKVFASNDNVCVSSDIQKIKKSICKDFVPGEDYPELEIWEDEKKIMTVEGGKVLHQIAKEMYQLSEAV